MALLAAVVHLSPGETPTPWLGRAAQAWLLESVRRADPTLADSLHTGQGRRPYTVSAPRGSDGDRWLRITSVDADLSAVLTDAVLPELRGPLRLAGSELTVTGFEIEKHPWAGQSAFETLARCAFDAAEPPSHLNLEFATPTAFHRDGLTIPLPLPALVYGGLIHTWNLFSPLPLPVPLLDFVERSVGIARHRLATRMVQFGNSERHIGFTGAASFVLLGRTNLPMSEYRQRAQALDLLTRFAFYTGVGVRTAVGMGQVRPI
jgi:CRISPR-associated endoribonuclease Cas6